MNRKSFRILATSLYLVLLVGIPLFAAHAAAAPKTETLKAVSFLPKDNVIMTYCNEFTKRVNEHGKGEITINYVGGPEVISGFNQMAALRNGSIDIIFNPTAYYAPNLPAADVLHLSPFTPMEERKIGFYDFMVRIHKQIGTYYLGRVASNFKFHIWTNKEISKIDDFRGMKLRSAALYDNFMKALGAVPVTVAWPEVYNAVKQNVIDGAGAAGSELAPESFAEMFKYIIWPEFYEQNLVAVVNLERWNKLSSSQQNVILDASRQIEIDSVAFFGKMQKDALAAMTAKGQKSVTLAPADSKKFLDLAYATSWEVAKKKVKPEEYEQVRKLLTK